MTHDIYQWRYKSQFERMKIRFLCKFWSITYLAPGWIRIRTANTDPDPGESNKCGNGSTTRILQTHWNILKIWNFRPGGSVGEGKGRRRRVRGLGGGLGREGGEIRKVRDGGGGRGGRGGVNKWMEERAGVTSLMVTSRMISYSAWSWLGSQCLARPSSSSGYFTKKQPIAIN